MKIYPLQSVNKLLQITSKVNNIAVTLTGLTC